ncbi:NAD-dependent succinate-semialdehyde dehydrogenase [Bordetella parapertussis]|uniref:Aldehyde dehydrogenase n=2 Tax=Bordetella parapertussis TaxID=519 RepID=Q7W420_BORPA|nr:NAD-dependent succinate-semialdehyde dehydrogenase [Bordetella parapertussis]AOB40768.1 NAD-dependent succinate-semialdehyde dehydrogenase [Bordetella parapertussis]AUL44807.1 NAD-dependent succinate-semialdehyde dehydrogenase [Bordetella parapertussis]AWP64708.1 NAD-dependent succinate-semialdehyde dehydrogenase [Bordetella parapertussis]AWP72213.1 NAD-dependent succinate-semialdehyde dehydrogenase [Bordetella parapertussis]AWP90815.1 NAD-dependent succinate-semialdehyde dehydrogenase [Bor
MENLGYPARLELYVAGQWRGVEGRRTQVVVNPSTQQPLGELPLASAEDIDDALAAADQAFGDWARTTAWERADILQRAAALIEARRDRLAVVLTLENGKPLADSHGELDRVVETILWCAEEGKRTYGRVLPARAQRLSQSSLKRPVGPVAAFVPWNFPAALAARKLAAAMAAGCTVVLKPAEETPAICIELVRAFVDAGTPAGVVNLLYGVPAQVSERLIASPIIRKVSFTGSVAVGRLLASMAAGHLKPATMELGGHAPVVVFDDVDADRVAKMCVGFKYRNAGQVCLSPSRFYVHERIADRFAESFVRHAGLLRVGDGMEEGVQMGPLNNVLRLQAAERLVEQAVGAGASLALGGRRIGQRGYFYPPTVLEGVPDAADILAEEPFCPVAPIMRFGSMDEVIGRANHPSLGLAAYAFTNRMATSAEFAERIEAGWIGINNFVPALADAPIGGMKDSGLGYEGGPEGLDAYLHARFVSQLNVEV